MKSDWIAASICKVPGCPSDTAEVEIFHKGKYIVGAAYTCIVCGNLTTEHYGEPPEDEIN